MYNIIHVYMYTHVLLWNVNVSAGVLIIWDRLFGTFEPESEKVIYGLVHPLATWDPFWAQIHHLVYILKTVWSHKGITGKLSFLFKGPGWSPGKPRLGCNEDIPPVSSKYILGLFSTSSVSTSLDFPLQVSPDEKPYDKSVPRWLNVYCSVHFLLVLYGSDELARMSKLGLPYLTVLAVVTYLIFAMTNFGLMFDLKLVQL